MGKEARARGSFEERKAAAIIRNQKSRLLWLRERQAREDAKSDQQRKNEASGRNILNMLFNMLETRNGVNLGQPW